MIVSPKFKGFCVVFVLFGVAGVALHAAPPLIPKPKTRLVDFVGDSYVEKETTQGTILTLSGNVKIVSDDTTLLTELATLNKKTSVANSPGKVRINDTQNSVIGDRGVAYYKTRDAKVTGNVVITIKPKQAPQKTDDGSLRNEFNAPITINCENGDYNWRDRVAVATGRLTFHFKDRTVTADKAVYYGNEEKVVLTGNVHYTRANRKDNGTSPQAIAIITEGKEEFTVPKSPGGVRGTMEVDEEEAPNATTPTKDGTNPPPKIGPRGALPTSPVTAPSLPTTPPANSPSSSPATP